MRNLNVANHLDLFSARNASLVRSRAVQHSYDGRKCFPDLETVIQLYELHRSNARLVCVRFVSRVGVSRRVRLPVISASLHSRARHVHVAAT
jgi:hypothetical protein